MDTGGQQGTWSSSPTRRPRRQTRDRLEGQEARAIGSTSCWRRAEQLERGRKRKDQDKNALGRRAMARRWKRQRQEGGQRPGPRKRRLERPGSAGAQCGDAAAGEGTREVKRHCRGSVLAGPGRASERPGEGAWVWNAHFGYSHILWSRA